MYCQASSSQFFSIAQPQPQPLPSFFVLAGWEGRKPKYMQQVAIHQKQPIYYLNFLSKLFIDLCIQILMAWGPAIHILHTDFWTPLPPWMKTSHIIMYSRMFNMHFQISFLAKTDLHKRRTPYLLKFISAESQESIFL